MPWRDNLRKASFRGVEFHYEGTDGDFGRRLARHEYPQRDVPFIEDMGRKAREHTVEAYLLEPDHMARAQALIAACEAAGPGTLVHPYLGSLQAVCTACRQRFTTREGGMARFTLTFVEAGENIYPRPAANTASVVGTKADAAASDVRGVFAGGFAVDGWPAHVAEAARAVLGDAGAAVAAALLPSVARGSPLAGFRRALDLLTLDAASLVQAPATLASRVASLMRLVAGEDAAGAPTAAWLGLSRFGADLAAVPLTTASRRAEAANQTALAALTRRLALTEAARAIAAAPFESHREAVAAREDFAARVDEETATADDTSYRALTGLLAAVVRDVAARAPGLPRILEYSPATARPVLAIAHDLYGDDPAEVPDRFDQIVARNRVRNPGLAGGGDVLEVLSRG